MATKLAKLLEANNKNPQAILEIGCGTGNYTQILAEKYPQAQILATDISAEMLAITKHKLAAYPNISYQLADGEKIELGGRFDLITSNAVFQWFADPVAEMKRLVSLLKPGAFLAVQMPDNVMEPSHVAMREVAQTEAFSAKIGVTGRTALPPVSDFYNAFAGEASRIDIWHTIYNHPLNGTDAIVEWVKSTGLRPFLDPLDEAEQSQYLSAYKTAISKYYPETKDGRVLLRFPRLFIVVQK